MSNLGFGDKWIGWLRKLFQSIRVSILLNGSPTREFSVSNGVRQGDSLSPLLFNLAVGVVSNMIEKASRLGLIKGVQIGRDKKQITHLQYAHDTIIFLSEDMELVIEIKSILQSFQLLFGLKINFSKSNLFFCYKDDQIIEEYVHRLGGKRDTWPLNFLGDQIGLSSRKKNSGSIN